MGISFSSDAANITERNSLLPAGNMTPLWKARLLSFVTQSSRIVRQFMIKSFAMYRCSVELSVRYDELSQSEREHASLIDEHTRLILRQTGSICVLI